MQRELTRGGEDLTRHDETWHQVTRIDRTWRDLTLSDKTWQYPVRLDTKWRGLSTMQWDLTLSDKTWQDVVRIDATRRVGHYVALGARSTSTCWHRVAWARTRRPACGRWAPSPCTSPEAAPTSCAAGAYLCCGFSWPKKKNILFYSSNADVRLWKQEFLKRTIQLYVRSGRWIVETFNCRINGHLTVFWKSKVGVLKLHNISVT